MSIDEAINFVESMMYLYRPTGEHHDKWCELLNLLRWYREQDLIPRKDALVRTAQTVSSNDIYAKMFIALKQIPKAEPPFARDTNVSDKLATDTNVAHKE